MRCPFCSHHDTQVVDTRSNPEANVIRRRRRCPKCDKRFTTYERVELRMPRLVKKDGSRTDFDREKLLGSMMVALRKRPVDGHAGNAQLLHQGVFRRHLIMGRPFFALDKIQHVGFNFLVQGAAW